MAPIIVAESAATARPSIGTFQTLSAGKIGQAGAPGTVGAPPGGGGGGGGAVVAGGWLEALRGSVPALYSAPSVQPSWSVSATRGFVPRRCSVVFERPSRSGFSRPSRRPSPSRVRAARRRAGQEFEGGPQPVAVGVLAAVADAVAVRVGPARVHVRDVFLPVGQAVVVGILAPVGQAVAVRVGRDGLVSEYVRSQVFGRPS